MSYLDNLDHPSIRQVAMRAALAAIGVDLGPDEPAPPPLTGHDFDREQLRALLDDLDEGDA